MWNGLTTPMSKLDRDVVASCLLRDTTSFLFVCFTLPTYSGQGWFYSRAVQVIGPFATWHTVQSALYCSSKRCTICVQVRMYCTNDATALAVTQSSLTFHEPGTCQPHDTFAQAQSASCRSCRHKLESKSVICAQSLLLIPWTAQYDQRSAVR